MAQRFIHSSLDKGSVGTSVCSSQDIVHIHGCVELSHARPCMAALWHPHHLELLDTLALQSNFCVFGMLMKPAD